MKKTRFISFALCALLAASAATSCSSDDPEPEKPITPEKPENPETPVTPPEEPEKQDYHFDIWVALDRHGGMGRDVQTLVRSLESLDADQPVINFVGTGTEVNYLLSLETIVKGAYYYQVPVAGDRFGKYTISDNKIQIVKENIFRTNTYSTRKYTHAWTDDNTLVIMAADGDATKILWTKLDASTMNIIAEGTLDLPLPEGAKVFTTSGILTFSSKSNLLYYFYFGKTGTGRGAKATSDFLVATIDPSDMKVKTNEINDAGVAETVGTAYGELLQKSTFEDESGNIYVAGFSVGDDDQETSSLRRINAGETNFDPSYNGFSNDGKLIAMEYLGGSKALVYARDDEFGDNIDSYSHYYAVIDLNTCKAERLSYNGETIPYSGGRFSPRMAYTHGKAYIGVNPENTNPCIYIYDVATSTLTKGAEMAEGYYFEQIRVVDNLPE